MSIGGLEDHTRVALLISECQQAMTVAEYRDKRDELARQVEERRIIPNVSELATAFRDANAPVIHSHLVARSDWRGFSVNCVLAGVGEGRGTSLTVCCRCWPPLPTERRSSPTLLKRSSALRLVSVG